MFGFIVRHTLPLCGTPLREGMGCRITHIVNALSIILSRSRCRAIPSRRGVAVGRGVSHHQTPTIPWCVAPSNTDNPGGCRIVKLAICRILSICGRFGFFFFQWLCGDNEHNCKFFYAIQLFCVHLQFQP